MRVTLFHCGPAANESELKSFEYLRSRLLAEPGNDEWVLLTNLAFSVTNQLQSDEIDIVVIGPTGVRVLEVKHWSGQWITANKINVETEVEKLTNKARKIGTSLRRVITDLPFVGGDILISQDLPKGKQLTTKVVRGVNLFTLNDWKEAIGLSGPKILSSAQVQQLANYLQPRSAVAIDGSLRRLAGYVNLELHSPKEERFHRVYKGSHPAQRDRVMVHLYDLSAGDQSAETKARRESEVLHHLQLYPWVPRILDTYQDAPGFSGEMSFFTIVDPAAPSLEERASDVSWTPITRLAFARSCVRALLQFHEVSIADTPPIHRNLTPRTILVKYDNEPIFTGFELSKIPSEISVASSNLPTDRYAAIYAPEVQTSGLSVGDQRSDVYSLCACLSLLFQDREDTSSQRAMKIFARGLVSKPSQRETLANLDTAISELLGDSVALPPPPPARFWTEGQLIRFNGHDYRILLQLGAGGVGMTFKVIEIDRTTHEETGTYVAKVANDEATGKKILRAYGLARSHLRHMSLSGIYDYAREWQENQFVALMTWIPGAPLIDYLGVFPLLADEQQESSSETLALRWLQVICDALGVLHRNGLVHGDISPRNLIVAGNDIVLIDYDFVAKVGDQIVAPGTVRYCSPSYQERRPASPADDLYALAASFFHVIFDKEPFRFEGDVDKQLGLNWEGIDREEFPTLVAFLDRATDPDPQQRFANIDEALAALVIPSIEQAKSEPYMGDIASPLTQSVNTTPYQPDQQIELRSQRVEWLRDVLQSYPGSHWGNRETRGIDTYFASHTYVETSIEKQLCEEILTRQVRLVILCGNAGDGKTALLQHMATQLGLGQHQSSDRILKGRIANGPLIRMNLDGSAAWQGRSADEILTEFMKPFLYGPPTEDIVHLLAINDGRLLEWLGEVEAQNDDEKIILPDQLYAMLEGQDDGNASYIRFISLNHRSLVGGVASDRQRIDTTFLERLVDQLYGGEEARDIWTPCLSCTAKDHCQVFQASRIFGPSTLLELEANPVRVRARQRLFDALQSVHLRGETHITMRELRAALVYILFGVHYCDDYHNEEGGISLPFWDRAFDATSAARQGELLSELIRFDPALEAHPKIDRYLLSEPLADSLKTAPHYPRLNLSSARRRAYFEWSADEIEQVADDRDALDLAQGKHIRLFRDLSLADQPKLDDLCARLCQGIARLEDLPQRAFEHPDVVPLRITSRTPTETAFWVEKPLSAFRLEVDLSHAVHGGEQLQRHAFLIYSYRVGNIEERLQLGADLFHRLLELADGYQLGDISTDDTFAHLSIFVQRLVLEDEQTLLAWNPMQDESIYRLSSSLFETTNGPQQRMVIIPFTSHGELPKGAE